jgi:hypothetical protein
MSSFYKFKKKFRKKSKNEQYRSGISIIKPTSFYSMEHEKIKINWFCYEISMGFFDEIKKTLRNDLKKRNVDDDTLAKFSIYMAKTMKNIILQKLSGKIESTYFSYDMVESYFPHFSEKLINKMLDAMSKAWDEQLDMCVICPTRCISEKDAYCTLFSDPYYIDEKEI